MTTRRLDAYLARCGVGTRSEVSKLIRAGRVTVDGELCRSAKHKVAEHQQVLLDGAPQVAPPEVLHLLLNKPTGYAVSRDPAEAPLFTELLPAAYQHLPLQPAGRLDRDTSGLLVVTSSGSLIQRLTHPKRQHPKRYQVRFEGSLPGDAVARFAAGMTLEEDPKPTRPAILQPGADGQAVAILHEGRYHQVRRMFAALGCEVTTLHRDRIGELDLPPDLALGDCREASEEELAALGTGGSGGTGGGGDPAAASGGEAEEA